MNRSNLSGLHLALLCLLAVPALAEKADASKPMEIEFGEAITGKKQTPTRLFKGVTIKQGTLQIQADEGTVLEDADGNRNVEMSGRPVHFKQKQDNGAELTARAERLQYNDKNGDVKLSGNAWLQADRDEISAAIISYNTSTEIYKVDGGAAGANGEKPRGKMILQPKQKPAEQGKP